MRNYEMKKYKKDWSIQDYAEYIIDNYKIKNTLHLFEIIYEKNHVIRYIGISKNV